MRYPAALPAHSYVWHLPPQMLRRALVLLLLLVVLTLSVHAGWWRAIDRAAATPVALRSPCIVLQTGYIISPWLSAQFATAYTVLLAALVAYRTRDLSAAWLLAGMLATAPCEAVLKTFVHQSAPRAALGLERPDCLGLVPMTAVADGDVSLGSAQSRGRGAAADASHVLEQYGLPTVAFPNSYPSGSVARLAYLAVLAVYGLGSASQWPRTRRTWQGVVAVLFLLLAGSRLPIGWHWPTDIVAGVLLGAALAQLALLAVRRSRRRPLSHPSAQATPHVASPVFPIGE